MRDVPRAVNPGAVAVPGDADLRMSGVGRIAVVVPAYNAETTIGRCVQGLRKAGFRPEDIVVVDDGSTDRTVEICEATGARTLRSDGNRGAAAARNAGVAVFPDADVLMFVDADVVVAPDGRSVVRDFFATHPGHAAVFGCYDAEPEEHGRVSRVRNLLHRHVHLEHAGEAETFWTGCGAVRRSAFDDVGGFDATQRMMEDIKFGMALRRCGHRIRLLPDLQGCHLKRWTLTNIARTDLFDRAMPWTRLILAGEASASSRTVSVDAASRIAVASVALSIVGLGVAMVQPAAGFAIAAAALAGMILSKARFFRALLTSDRPADALAAVVVIWVHYFCAGAGYLLVRLGF